MGWGRWFGLLWLGSAGILGGTEQEEVVAEEEPTLMVERIWTWSGAQLGELIDVILPETTERRTWRVKLSPRLGDLKNRDHFRLPVGIAYGLNRRTEAELVFDAYVPNPFKDGNRTGVANIRPKLQYQWVPGFDDSISAASGIRGVFPMHNAPYEINDGMNRGSVFTTFSRPVWGRPEIEKFLTLSYDVLTPSSVDGEIRRYRPQDDHFQVTVGGFYHAKRLTYGLAFSWAQTTDNDRQDYFYVTPSVLMQVPKRWVFDSPGQWQVGTSLELRRFGGETDVSLRVRVRWVIDFKYAVRTLMGNGDADIEQ